MKTVVFQSYRTHDVAPWIERCLQSVRRWSQERGYEYRFFDDEILDVLPKWFRDSYHGRFLPLTDFARLLVARRFLQEGWARTVWVDADVVVFRPEAFSVETERRYALCAEIWAEKRWGNPILDRRINNCVSVYDAGNPFLDFYTSACETIAMARRERLTDWDIGTTFLSSLGTIVPLPLLSSVGMLSPALTEALLGNESATLRAFMQATGEPLAAANICGSAVRKIEQSRPGPEGAPGKVVDLLLGTGGDALNRHLPHPTAGG